MHVLHINTNTLKSFVIDITIIKWLYLPQKIDATKVLYDSSSSSISISLKTIYETFSLEKKISNLSPFSK